MHSFVCHKLLLSFFSLLVHITFCSHLWNALSEVSYTLLKMSLWGISNQWCLCWAAFHEQNQGDCCSTANPLQLWPFRSKPYCRSEAALPFYPLRFGFSTLPPPPSSLHPPPSFAVLFFSALSLLIYVEMGWCLCCQREHSQSTALGNVQIFFFPTSKFILVLMNLTDTVVVNCILFN